MNTNKAKKTFIGTVINPVDAVYKLYKVEWEYKLYQKICKKVDYLYFVNTGELRAGDKVEIEDNSTIKIVRKL